MKPTEHFRDKQRRERPEVLDEYCDRVIQAPAHREVEPRTGRISLWGYIEELRHYLKVVLLEDGESVLTAYIDGRAERWIVR